MARAVGRSLALSLPRRFVGDLVHFARQVPTVPVQRRMALAEVAGVRAGVSPRVGWAAVFTKAFALTAALRPELRRAYLSFPVPHLYEHPFSIASVAVERQWRGEDAVFFGQLKEPEAMPLAEIQSWLRHLRDRPVESISSFRRTLNLARLPRPLRRAAWWFGLNAWGRKRAHYLGTFGVSVYAALGAASLHPLSPLAVALNYGVLDAEGMMDVRLVYDHRVMDGGTVARALAAMEDVLRRQILEELRGLRAGLAA